MGYYKLKETLQRMSRKQSRYNAEICGGVIDAIIGHYMTFCGYYEEDAIISFNRFLDAGILEF